FADGKVDGLPQLLGRRVGNPARLGNLGVSLSGDQYSMIYDRRSAGPDIQVAEIDSAGKPLSPPVPAAKTFFGTNMYPAWSSDGKYLAYASLRDSYVVIGVRSMETGQVRDVVPSPNFRASQGNFWSLTWGPGGTSFIVTAQNNKYGNGIF